MKATERYQLESVGPRWGALSERTGEPSTSTSNFYHTLIKEPTESLTIYHCPIMCHFLECGLSM